MNSTDHSSTDHSSTDHSSTDHSSTDHSSTDHSSTDHSPVTRPGTPPATGSMPSVARWDPSSIPTALLDDARVVAGGLAFPEGPVAFDDGTVVVTEVDGARIVRIGPDGHVDVVAVCGGGPNGAAVGPDGALYVCNNGGRYAGGNYQGGWIERVEVDSGDVEVLFTECDGRRLSGPNDIVFDDTGGFWFTDTGKFRGRERDVGSVYYVAPGADHPTEVIHPAETPNGIGISPDGSTLYYAETTTGRLRRRAILEPGRPSEAGAHDPATLVCGLPGDQLFDSLAVDSDGNVCIGTLLTGCITVVAPDGGVTQLVPPDELADHMLTNICFGGPDRHTAYITAAATGRLLACTWPVAGAPLAYTA